MQPIITYIPNSSWGDKLHKAALAARLCYSSNRPLKPMDEHEEIALIRRVLQKGHMSILEHCEATFLIEKVSRNFTHQLVRHRHMAFSQQSLHYTVATDNFEIAEGHRDHWENCKKSVFKVYKQMIHLGVKPEQARHILPSGIETKILVTANLRQWLQFLDVRLCATNCTEMIVVADQIKEQLEQAFPILKEFIGPKCKFGICMEGKKYCGRKGVKVWKWKKA